MATTKKPAVPMCCITIGHCDYLLPLAKGMKVVELLQDAFDCRKNYGDRGYEYVPSNPVEGVELVVVRPNQVRAPDATPRERQLPAPGTPTTLDEVLKR